MEADSILILLLAAFAVWSLVHLAITAQRHWDGDIEDLFEDVVVRRMIRFGIAAALLAAALLLRGSLRSLLAMAFG